MRGDSGDVRRQITNDTSRRPPGRSMPLACGQYLVGGTQVRPANFKPVRATPEAAITRVMMRGNRRQHPPSKNFMAGKGADGNIPGRAASQALARRRADGRSRRRDDSYQEKRQVPGRVVSGPAPKITGKTLVRATGLRRGTRLSAFAPDLPEASSASIATNPGRDGRGLAADLS